MNPRLQLNFAFSIVAVTAFACKGGGQAEPATPAESAAVEIPATWSKASMTLDQQVAFMKQKVVPALGPVFQAHNAAEFSEFGCKTCHGPDNQEPTVFLPHLKLKGGKITSFEESPEVSQFMAEKVVPAMATALGVEPYNLETHQGFGCAGCHAIDNEG